MPLGYEPVWKQRLRHFCPFFVQILGYVSIWTKICTQRLWVLLID
jgi:hypothetical protein